MNSLPGIAQLTTVIVLFAVTACTKDPQPRSLATAGNLNNDIGMPLMLTRIEDSHRYAVIEMGANHQGEIAYLANLEVLFSIWIF